MRRTTTITLLLFATSAALSLWAAGKVPDPMPTHWNLRGEPDGFMPRWIGLSLFPALVLLLPGLILGLVRIDPRRRHVDDSSGAIGTMVVATSAFLLFIHAVTLRAAMSEEMTLDGSLIVAGVGALLAALGFVMPNVRSNWFVGIRTPWTLSDDEIWERTHKVAGRAMTWSGGAALLCALLLPDPYGLWIALVALIGAVIVPVGYSYVLWRRGVG